MKTVLIAEDNAVNRVLCELLEGRGYRVFEACHGEEALAMMEAAKPDILLLDVGMPGLDGFGVARRIRDNPKLEDLPVLAVTAYAMQGDREKILNSGFDGYLSKPINPAGLDRELELLMSRNSR